MGPAPASADDFGGAFPSGMVSLAPGMTKQQVTVGILGDVAAETNEQFVVALGSPSGGAVLSRAAATGLIQNDDIAFVEVTPDDGGDSEPEVREEERENRRAALQLEFEPESLEPLENTSSRVVAEAISAEEEQFSRSSSVTSQGQPDETARTGDIKLFFMIVDVSGEEVSKEYELPAESLIGDRLERLFKKFPNGHYRVFLQQDRAIRRLYDLHVYNNELVTPENSEGEAASQRDNSTDQIQSTPPRDPGLAPVEKVSAGPQARFILSQGDAPHSTIEDGTPDARSHRPATVPFDDSRQDPGTELPARYVQPAATMLLAGGALRPKPRCPWADRVDEALQAGPSAISRSARIVRHLRS
jgi:hypothetical protein